MLKKSLWLNFLLVLGMAALMAPIASAAPEAAGLACAKTYTVAAADWLSKLSDKEYGSITAYWPIMAATNQQAVADTSFTKIDNADVIEVGQKLCIPSKTDAQAFLVTFDPNKPWLLFGSGKSGQLVVGSWWTSGGEFAGLGKMFQMFKTQNSGVEIVNAAIAGGAGTNFKGQLLTQMLGGVAPDAFQLHAGLEVALYNPGTLVVPIDDVYTANGLDKAFPAQLLTLLKYQGHYWGVPVNIHRENMLWYNKTAFTKASITAPPATWDEFFADADKLKAAGIAPVSLGGKDGFELDHTFEAILVGTLGADGYKGLWTGATSWKDPRVTTALNTFKKYISYANTDHDALGWANATDLLVSGKAAMNIMGDWAVGEFIAQNFTDYGWAPAPGSKGIFDMLSDSFALPAKAPNPQNAKAWLGLVSTKAAQEVFNPLKGSICARSDCNPALFNAYSQSALADWSSNALVPSVTHGAAAVPAWSSKGYHDPVVLFAVNGNVATAQSALVAAATTAGFPQ
jgi:glucose/mannose transport system substrate-binding protein